jgi:cell division protein FtsL
MDIFSIIVIMGLICVIGFLYNINKNTEKIREMVEMSEQQRHEYNLSIDDPELHDDIQIAKEVEKLRKK